MREKRIVSSFLFFLEKVLFYARKTLFSFLTYMGKCFILNAIGEDL